MPSSYENDPWMKRLAERIEEPDYGDLLGALATGYPQDNLLSAGEFMETEQYKAFTDAEVVAFHAYGLLSTVDIGSILMNPKVREELAISIAHTLVAGEEFHR